MRGVGSSLDLTLLTAAAKKLVFLRNIIYLFFIVPASTTNMSGVKDSRSVSLLMQQVCSKSICDLHSSAARHWSKDEPYGDGSDSEGYYEDENTGELCAVWRPSDNVDGKCDKHKKLNIADRNGKKFLISMNHTSCPQCYKMYHEKIWNEHDTIEYYEKYFRLTWPVVHPGAFRVGCACDVAGSATKCEHNDWFYRVDGENKPATIAQLFESAFCCIDYHNQKYFGYSQGQSIYERTIRGGMDNAKEIIKSHQKFILEFLGKGILSKRLENELKVRHSFNCPIAQSPLTVDQRGDLYRIARSCYISALSNWATIICDVENKGILCEADKFTGRLADSCEGVFRSYASYLQAVLQPLLSVFVSFFHNLYFFNYHNYNFFSALTPKVYTLVTYLVIGIVKQSVTY